MEDLRQQQKRYPPMTWPLASGLKVTKGENGFVLIEMLIATVLLGVVVTVFLASLATGSRAVVVVDTRIELTRLAQSQMEATLSQPYLSAPTSYPSIAAPSGYSVTAAAELLTGAGSDIQRIVVSVYRDGELRRTLEAFKFNQ